MSYIIVSINSFYVDFGNTHYVMFVYFPIWNCWTNFSFLKQFFWCPDYHLSCFSGIDWRLKIRTPPILLFVCGKDCQECSNRLYWPWDFRMITVIRQKNKLWFLPREKKPAQGGISRRKLILTTTSMAISISCMSTYISSLFAKYWFLIHVHSKLFKGKFKWCCWFSNYNWNGRNYSWYVDENK